MTLCTGRAFRQTNHARRHAQGSSAFPSALGNESPASFASVGAISRISITPRSFPAGTPGPTKKNAARKSGTSGNSPCVPPGFIFDVTGPGERRPCPPPRFQTHKKRCVRITASLVQFLRLQHAIDSIRGIAGKFRQQRAHFRKRGLIVWVFQHNRRRSAGFPRHRPPVRHRAFFIG